MTLRILALTVTLVAGTVSNAALAAYIDLTDNATIGSLSSFSNPASNGFTGTVDGVGFTLSARNSDGLVNFNEVYDGSLNTGCQSGSGPLMCQRDGTGIRNDEITGFASRPGQTLSLVFDTQVILSRFDFLDLYVNPDGQRGEQATVNIDGVMHLVDAIESSGEGGYASLDFLAMGGPILGTSILFTANPSSAFWDDSNNDYAFAGVEVSAVPVPAAVWLFGSALVGLLGFKRRRKSA